MKRLLTAMLALGVSAIPFAASAQGYDPYYRGDTRYGYDDRYGGQQVRCESNDHRTRMCRIDTRGGVRIVRQESDAPCVRGRTWGYDRSGIWVSRGCRARFEVGGSYASNDYRYRDNWRYDDNYNDRYGYGSGSRYYNGYYGTGYTSGGAQAFRCESINGQPRFCRLPYQARGVEIRRQLSDTRCSQGYNWGWQRDGVWVERGCRAEFVAY